MTGNAWAGDRPQRPTSREIVRAIRPGWLFLAFVAVAVRGGWMCAVSDPGRNAMSIGEGKWTVFLDRPVSVFLLVVIAAVLVLPRLARWHRARG